MAFYKCLSEKDKGMAIKHSVYLIVKIANRRFLKSSP
ncbi:hypothetical protein T4A_12412 [Trichinella pseudospiralis]|uniref:Uncharacterized protein n=1 Tax=Trichinella pseudospiralis TaxID=6337 RepID=A0A0V1DR10_TRIPS|nr:hypothetical protein T4A_12412 [Trichinella pseudospiralis]